jgi:hypothetical protein
MEGVAAETAGALFVSVLIQRREEQFERRTV